MKKLFENLQGSARRMISLAFVVGGCFISVFLALGMQPSDSKSAPLPCEDIRNLFVPQSDIPFQGVLFAFEYGASSAKYYDEVWFGPPSGEMKTADYTVRVNMSIARSPQEALAGIHVLLDGVAEPPQEVSGEPYSSFSDYAWFGYSGHSGGRLLFVRGNMVADIVVFHKDGFDQKVILALATILSRKIDAVLAGKPEPVPILPLAADQELRVDLEGAWKMRDLGARLWGAESTTIAIYDTDGIPRSLPAKRVGGIDYVVPLRHLAAIIGPRARVKTSGDEAKVTLMGKVLVLKKGKSEMQVDQRTAQLDRTVEFTEGEVLVPLASVVSNASGQRIAWEQRGTIMIGRVE